MRFYNYNSKYKYEHKYNYKCNYKYEYKCNYKYHGAGPAVRAETQGPFGKRHIRQNNKK